jgi:hypothetical protein
MVTEIYIERDSDGRVVGVYSSDPETVVTMISENDPMLEEGLCTLDLMYCAMEVNNKELAADG